MVKKEELAAKDSGQDETAQFDDTFTAEAFGALVESYEIMRAEARKNEREVGDPKHLAQVKESIERHISRTEWREKVKEARLAAKEGRRQFELLRFPSDACTDGGRAINNAEPGWTSTLRGEAADIATFYEADLREKGFELNPAIVSFRPDGVLDDAAIYLAW